MIARSITIALAACALTFTAPAQQNLQDMVQDARADWMFGKWQAETDNGTATLNISWDLDKHVVVFHVKTSDMESKGYTVKEPNSDEIVYVNFDNRGSLGKGKWSMESDELVLRMDTKNADRSWKWALVFYGSESKGLMVRMHALDSAGDIEYPARTEFKFKKQK